MATKRTKRGVKRNVEQVGKSNSFDWQDKQIIGISCRINVKIWHNTSYMAVKVELTEHFIWLQRRTCRRVNSTRKKEWISCYERIWRIFFTFSWSFTKPSDLLHVCFHSEHTEEAARECCRCSCSYIISVIGWMNSRLIVVQQGSFSLNDVSDLLTWIHRGFVREQLFPFDADISGGTMWLKLHIGIAFYFYYNHQNL